MWFGTFIDYEVGRVLDNFQSTLCDSLFLLYLTQLLDSGGFQSTLCDSRVLVRICGKCSRTSFNPLCVIHWWGNYHSIVTYPALSIHFVWFLRRMVGLLSRGLTSFNPLCVILFSLIVRYSVVSILFRVFQIYHWNMFIITFLMIVVFWWEIECRWHMYVIN